MWKEKEKKRNAQFGLQLGTNMAVQDNSLQMEERTSPRNPTPEQSLVGVTESREHCEDANSGFRI